MALFCFSLSDLLAQGDLPLHSRSRASVLRGGWPHFWRLALKESLKRFFRLPQEETLLELTKEDLCREARV